MHVKKKIQYMDFFYKSDYFFNQPKKHTLKTEHAVRLLSSLDTNA